MPQDATVREEALALDKSFIVQAPAGSGKTTLLTERFLNLLSIVDSPESVVALTFTRKAASEMKERIISVLLTARDKPETLAPATLKRALQVLTRDKLKGWHLLEATHRLRVMTLDALCQWLIHSLPIHADYLGQAQIDKTPLLLYREAAQRCLEECTAPVLPLLAHLDNRQDRLIALWVELLASRDQWLPVLYENQTLTHSALEEVLSHFTQHHLEKLRLHLPTTLQTALCDLCQKLDAFKDLTDFKALHLQQAKRLAKMLLTTTGSVRKSLDSHTGVRRTELPKPVYDALKAESSALFAEIGAYEAFVSALIDIGYVPGDGYDLTQWEILQALFSVLPRLVAHLTLVFRERHRVDFIEVANCAKAALGHEEAPSDLALYLDYAIQHLLIDEFQDTSFSQFQLLLQLMLGFEANDGRTVFIVGDPMQSIYRFRQAEVGLFLQVQREGMGQKQLKPLYLTSNFRSNPALVTWVNQHFASLFPKVEDIAAGAVLFRESLATQSGNAEIQAIETLDMQAEAQVMLTLIRDLRQQHPEETMAILVRSRKHLECIVPLLQAEQIDFEGSDLFSLSKLLVLQDLWHLTQVLLLPQEKLPWLCLLRSPYVGLTLADLHQVAIFSDDIYGQLLDAPLSEDGRARLRYVQGVFAQAFAEKDQLFLADWVMKVHEQLHGQKHLSQEDTFHVMQFLELLSQFTEHNTITDWDMLSVYFKRLYADALASSPLKIMTIHQAKGLEFDTVFMPGLGAKTRPSQAKLLRFAQFLQENDAPLWLISPLKPAEADSDAVYDYLNYLERQREVLEEQRLLYVGVTRAKKRLILLDNHTKVQTGSFRDYLGQQVFASVTPKGTAPVASNTMQVLRHPLGDYLAPINPLAGDIVQLEQASSQKEIGTLTHYYIQCVCEQGIQEINQLPLANMEKACEALGFEKDVVMATLLSYFKQLFETPIGQWIIKPHMHAKNEYAFNVFEAGSYKTYIVDRLFFEKDTWWIIDFKTGSQDAMEAHRAQVNRYARHLANRHCERSEAIHKDDSGLLRYARNDVLTCGLFYLESGHFESWSYL